MGTFAGIVFPHTIGMGELVLQMLNAMAHRGCGEEHSIAFHNIEVGCSNCSHFHDSKNHTILACDGKIYNANTLRNTLKENGYQFTSDSTAEVLINAYQFWGKECFKKLEGEFVLFICEYEKRKMILARDPLGKKPLFWSLHQDHLLFATECKALLASGLLPPTPAPESLAAYLFFGYLPQDMTLLDHVNRLLPGYYLEFRADRSMSILPFWSLSSYFEKKTLLSEKEIPRQLDHYLKESVTKRLPEDSSVGCFISGGLGSASIAHYVKQANSRTLSAYTTVFEKENEADLDAAKIVAETLHIEHYIKTLNPSNCIQFLPQILWFLDEPIADPHIIATWTLAREASKNTSHVFSGMGSDELLAGHTRYALSEQRPSFFDRCQQSMGLSIRKYLLPLVAWMNRSDAFAWTRQLQTNPWQYLYLQQNALFSIPLLQKAAPNLAHLFNPRVFLNKFYHLSRLPSTLSTLLYFDVKTRLADCYMLQYERLTTAHGLQWEAPFIDRTIVEFLASVPTPDFLKEQEAGKWLREILRPVFPPSVVDRPKRVRPTFLAKWASQEPLSSLFLQLQKGILVETGVIHEKWLTEQLSTPTNREQAFPFLWAILILEIWFRLFIQGNLQTEIPHVSTSELLR